MHDLHYCCEVFGKAVMRLAASDEPLRERLRDAFAGEALMAYGGSVTTGNFAVSPDLSERLERFKESMTERPDPADLGTIKASVYLMSDDEVIDAARELVNLYWGLESERTGAMSDLRHDE